MGDKDIYGSDSISKRIASFKDREVKKQIAKVEQQEKLMEEYRKKEEEKLAPFKALVCSSLF